MILNHRAGIGVELFGPIRPYLAVLRVPNALPSRIGTPYPNLHGYAHRALPPLPC